MDFRYSEKLARLPSYMFAEIDKLKKRLISEGKDVIDLGIGDPDMPTDSSIVRALAIAAGKTENHRYPSYSGLIDFRIAVAQYMKQRFGVDLKPESEIISLIGSKEGIFHFPLAFAGSGDVVLCPDPAYPVYQAGAVFSGASPYSVPLREENDFLPDLSVVPASVLKRSKILWVNYPNNPTSAQVSPGFFEELIYFARDKGIIVCHDAAYCEIYDETKPPSILSVQGAKEVAIEFHSLSKTFNMAGWRVGFACGNEKLIAGLSRVKTNVDSGVFLAVQHAAIEAFGNRERLVMEVNKTYARRRSIIKEALKKSGIGSVTSGATFYVWARVPEGFSSDSFCRFLLERAGVLVTPGTGFGPSGEGYFRVALNQETSLLIEATRRITLSKVFG